MKTELTMVIMAGMVLSLFLVVGEIAALRKRAKRILTRFRALYGQRSFARLAIELCALALLFLAQPFIIATLTALALNGLHPDFSGHVIRQIRDML